MAKASIERTLQRMHAVLDDVYVRGQLDKAPQKVIVTLFNITQAFKHAPAGIVCTFGFIDEPVCVLVGYIFFGEVLDLLQWSGLLLLGIGISVLTFIKEEEKQHDNS